LTSQEGRRIDHGGRRGGSFDFRVRFDLYLTTFDVSATAFAVAAFVAALGPAEDPFQQGGTAAGLRGAALTFAIATLVAAALRGAALLRGAAGLRSAAVFTFAIAALVAAALGGAAGAQTAEERLAAGLRSAGSLRTAAVLAFAIAAFGRTGRLRSAARVKTAEQRRATACLGRASGLRSATLGCAAVFLRTVALLDAAVCAKHSVEQVEAEA